MRSVTIVMALASAWLIIFGALILKGKAMDKAIDKRKEEIKDLKNYMKFNGIFYIIMGIIGIILTLIEYFMGGSNTIIIIFIVIMIGSGFIQGFMGKKYK